MVILVLGLLSDGRHTLVGEHGRLRIPEVLVRLHRLDRCLAVVHMPIIYSPLLGELPEGLMRELVMVLELMLRVVVLVAVATLLESLGVL